MPYAGHGQIVLLRLSPAKKTVPYLAKQVATMVAVQGGLYGIDKAAQSLNIQGEVRVGIAVLQAILIHRATFGKGPKAPSAKAQNMKANAAAGHARQARVQQRLEGKYKNASVQREQYLRTSDGKIAKDPITGQGRRMDHVVIEGNKSRAVVETTSKTANKTAQIAKEIRIRNSGGTYIRNRETGQLVDISNTPTREVRVK